MPILAKAIYVSLIAGVLAALPFAILFSYGMESSLILYAALRFLVFGIGCSLLLGLPISLLVFHIIRRDPEFDFSDLMLIANGMAVILATFLGLWSGWFGVFFFGVPIILAANVFGVLGWRKIVVPYRADLND